MSKTRRQYTKKELVTAEIHRKAGPHNSKKKEPKVCRVCKGAGVIDYTYKGIVGLLDCPVCNRIECKLNIEDQV